MFKIGDYVVRKSYGKDILFRIENILPNNIAVLLGVSFRIAADAPLDDLERAEGMRYTKREDSTMVTVENNVKVILAKRNEYAKTKMRMFEKPGTVLHLDGDAFYLELCMKYYEKLGIEAVGKHIVESEQPKRIKALIEKYNPSILVITGHDSLNKNYKDISDIREYKNSKYYIETVIQARTIRPHPGALVIFAGACQSDFEALLEAGADFAASPSRVLIHALDPVFIVERIAYHPFYEVLGIEEVLKFTITGLKGLGGYETQGKCRRGGPMVLKEEKVVKAEDTEIEVGEIKVKVQEIKAEEIEVEKTKEQGIITADNARKSTRPYVLQWYL
ncbi:MAG TPA: sporulation peptidase YabG [Epulopiscium sp.]|nr:sporulation peptidase YabG [Candidatus Epulonipiscium sp.]